MPTAASPCSILVLIPLSHPWKCSRPARTGLAAACSGGRCFTAGSSERDDVWDAAQAEPRCDSVISPHANPAERPVPGAYTEPSAPAAAAAMDAPSPGALERGPSPSLTVCRARRHSRRSRSLSIRPGAAAEPGAPARRSGEPGGKARGGGWRREKGRCRLPPLTSRAIWLSASSSAVRRSRFGSRLRPAPGVPMAGRSPAARPGPVRSAAKPEPLPAGPERPLPLPPPPPPARPSPPPGPRMRRRPPR